MLKPEEISSAVNLIVKAAGKRDYSQHSALLATLCKLLPDFAKKIGKQNFKRYMEQFFDVIFYCVDREHMALVSGENCIIQLSQMLGPSIFRGRVQNYNPIYLKHLDRLIPPTL